MNEAELLFTNILGCDRASLYLRKGLTLDKNKSKEVSLALKRRIKGEPLQYILGKTEFMGFDFKVGPGVLIPRPETERLVETALRYARPPDRKVSVLDLGTGSGCIGISLARMLSRAEVVAVDISAEALVTARENAALNNVSARVRFLQSDLFDSLERHAQFDICVSNPPYICSGQVSRLQKEIQFEPGIALDGGKDGLDFYRRIIDQAPAYLKEGGYLILETGFGQCASLRKILQNSLNFEIIEVGKDYNNIDRVIVGKKKSYG